MLQLLPPSLTRTHCNEGRQQQQPGSGGGCVGLERVRDVSEELGLDVGEPTLACGLILEGYIAQVMHYEGGRKSGCNRSVVHYVSPS